MSDEIVTHLRANLERELPRGEWRSALQALNLTGVADRRQLAQAAGLSRDQLRRVLAKLQTAAAGLPALIVPRQAPARRRGRAGRSAEIYLLGEGGARLLTAEGLGPARSAGLEQAAAIQHALAMVDLALAARGAGRPCVLDRPLTFVGQRQIRPDALITLADGVLALFEIEQEAGAGQRVRLRESLQHKQAFFTSPEGRGYHPDVRVLFALPPGAGFERACRAWRDALSELGRAAPLAFRLLARPLADFQALPDWESQPDPARWLDLTHWTPEALQSATAPYTPRQDWLLAAAEVEAFRRGRVGGAPPAMPDPHFFSLARELYRARQWPGAAEYTLRSYLQRHPELRAALETELSRTGPEVRWNISQVLHRMQQVVDVFLAYHGWAPDDPRLQARPLTRDWFDRESRATYGVSVSLPGLDLPPREQLETERAVAWLLRAVFEKSEQLGLPRPVYW